MDATAAQKWTPFWHVDAATGDATPAYGVMLCFAAVITLGMELLSELVSAGVARAFARSPTLKPLPHNPKHHLDALEATDRAFIGCNKALTVVFVYHLVSLVLTADHIAWSPRDLTVANTFGALAAFFGVYDLFYASFHCLLHLPSLYRFVHKHHHRQISPTRGNYDAINVHPFEFLVGEYLHLFVVWLVPCHVATVAAFIIVGGVLASLNHTRLDLDIPFFYSVKNHDIHHRWPRNNMGQYCMLWDQVFGWYRKYDVPRMFSEDAKPLTRGESAPGVAEANKAKRP